MPGATGTAQSLNTTRRFSPALTTTMPQRSQRSFSQSHLTHERLTVFPTPRQIRTKPNLQHIKKGGLISQPALCTVTCHCSHHSQFTEYFQLRLYFSLMTCSRSFSKSMGFVLGLKVKATSLRKFCITSVELSLSTTPFSRIRFSPLRTVK